MDAMLPSYVTPDPGQYQAVSSKRSPMGANNPVKRGLAGSKLSNTNFSQADLSNNNSGVRVMPTNGQHARQDINKVSPKNTLELSANVLGLKQRG